MCAIKLNVYLYTRYLLVDCNLNEGTKKYQLSTVAAEMSITAGWMALILANCSVGIKVEIFKPMITTKFVRTNTAGITNKPNAIFLFEKGSFFCFFNITGIIEEKKASGTAAK